jgi:hypothetical protein
MEIRVFRLQLDPDCTIGAMTVDGAFECWTCEDTVRAPGAPKVFGQTAIPAGRYEVEVTYSPHFNRDLPELADVPNFQGVRIHPGNTAADTEGCILVGQIRQPKGVGSSVLAFNVLFPKIRVARDAGEQVFITIG